MPLVYIYNTKVKPARIEEKLKELKHFPRNILIRRLESL